MSNLPDPKWPSTPAAFCAAELLNPTVPLNAQERCMSGSKLTRKHLQNLHVLVQDHTDEQNPAILDHLIRLAEQDVSSNDELLGALIAYPDAKTLCATAQKRAGEANAIPLRAMYDILYKIVVPAAVEISPPGSDITMDDSDDSGSAFDPLLDPQVDDDEGLPTTQLEILTHMLSYLFLSGVLTSHRLHIQVGDSLALLEFSPAADSGILKLELPKVVSKIEDDGGADFHYRDARSNWVVKPNYYRSLIYESKNTMARPLGQHAGQFIKTMQKRLAAREVESAAELDKLSDDEFEIIMITSHVRFIGIAVSYIPKLWCRRHFFNDQSAPPFDGTKSEEYMIMHYYDIAAHNERFVCATHIIAVVEYTQDLLYTDM